MTVVLITLSPVALGGSGRVEGVATPRPDEAAPSMTGAGAARRPTKSRRRQRRADEAARLEPRRGDWFERTVITKKETA